MRTRLALVEASLYCSLVRGEDIRVMSAQHAALQSTVASCLTAILGTDQNQRKAAEDELKALEVTEEFGVVLAEITVSTESPLVYRQLASIILKQYVEVHWSTLGERFIEPMPSEETKASIRRLLPGGLNDPQSKVRATVAYAISAIAHWDWPENWPDLFDQLIPALGSGEPNLVHGTMRVLSEFCHDVSDQQMPHMAPIILPQLLKVILESQVYGARTRSRAVHIASTFMSLIYAMSETFTEAIKTLLLPTLPDFLAAFIHILSSRDPANTDPGLVKEIIMTLCSLLRSLPRALTPHIMQIVTPIWNLLLTSTPVYVQSVVNAVEVEGGEVCDSDGEVVGRERATFAMFEFITVLTESSRLQRLLPPILPELVYLLITHMQITEDQVHTWLVDVNQFVDEDENEFSYSIRLSAWDLLQSLGEEEGLCNVYYGAVVAAIERHLQETPQQSTAHWWKVHEACMLAVSCVVGAVKAQRVQFDCETFIERILLPDMSVGVSPLLTGRCLWLAAKMTTQLKPDTTAQILQAVASGLQSSQHGVVQVLATKATYHCCSELSTEHVALLKPYLPHFLEYLVEMAGNSTSDVVPLVVDSLHLVTQVDQGVTAQCSNIVVPVAMALFLKYSHDPGISLCVEELFGALASNPGCHGDLHSRFLPTAMEILQSNESQLPLGLVAAVLDVLVPLVRGCKVGGLPETFVSEVFPCVVQRVLDSDDSSLLQNGGECVRAFVSTGVEQLARWVDSSGRNGLQYVVKVILHLLDPIRPEFSAAFVGKLLITFVKKAGNVLGEHLEMLLRSVLSKMQSVSTSSVMQSLLLVFAHLIQSELESVVSFLSQVPDPQGQPALNFVMTQWCTRHPSFFGVYEMRVSSLALTKILTHCVGTNDERLTKITVDGEEVMVHSEGIQTRSKRAAVPHQWTKVPLPVKVLKLLISDIQNAIEAQTAGQGEEEDEQESDEEVDDERVGDVTTLEALLAPASDFPGYDAMGGEDWEREEDPDLVDEPVLQLDMQAHLAGYLRELSQQPCFGSFLQMLTNYEKHTLRTVGILPH